MIHTNTIHQVNDAVRVEDIVGEFVTLKKAGANYKACCPFHAEKTPSFSVNSARNIFKCFGCGKGGDAVTFLMELKQWSYPEAVKYIAKRYNIEIQETAREDDPKHDERTQIRATLAAVQAAFVAQDENPGRTYFKGRGYSDEILDTFGIGFCDAVKIPLIEPAALIQAGIANAETGHISAWSRATIPIHDHRGNFVSFAGRVVEAAKDGAKYINGRETAAYAKGRMWYNLHRAAPHIRKAGEVWVVEGYADAMAMTQGGIANVVSMCGTAITDDQVALLKPFNGDRPLKIFLAYDNETSRDADNHKPQVEQAYIAALKKLLHLGEVRVVQWPKGCKDAGEMLERGKSFQALPDMAEDAIENYVKSRWSKDWAENASPVEKAEFQELVGSMIAGIKKDTVRDIYVKNLSAIIETGVQKLDQIVRRAGNHKETGVNDIRHYKHVKICDQYKERQPVIDLLTGHVRYTYVTRKKDEIKDEYGRDYLREIPRFTNYILRPEHIGYRRIITHEEAGTRYMWFNRYEPLPYKPVEFELPADFYKDKEGFDYEQIPEIRNTARFFKHIYAHTQYGNRFVTLGWDYLAIMYLMPMQRLPAQALVSKEEGTGKSTLLNFFLRFFGDNAGKSEVGRIVAKFNSQFSGKVFVGIEETKDEKGNIENLLKDLITSFDRVVERKFEEATVEPSYEKYMFLSNHEDSFMKVGTETTRFFVMKVQPIPEEEKQPDFEQVLFKEIPYVMHFLQKRGIITPKEDRLYWKPARYENEALLKLRQASKDVIHQNMEELVGAIFLRTEYDAPVLRFTSEYLRKMMIAYGGRLYENKTPNYFGKVAQNDLRAYYAEMPSKRETIILKPIEEYKDLATISTWEYEVRRMLGRHLFFPVWQFCSPQEIAENYTRERAEKLLHNLRTEAPALIQAHGYDANRVQDFITNLHHQIQLRYDPQTVIFEEEDLPF